MRPWRSLLIAVSMLAASVASAQVEQQIMIYQDSESSILTTKTELISELSQLGVPYASAKVNEALAPFEGTPIVPVEKISDKIIGMQTVHLVNRYLLLKLQVFQGGKLRFEIPPLKSRTLGVGQNYALRYGNTCVNWTPTGGRVFYTAVVPWIPGTCKFAVGCTLLGAKGYPAFLGQKMGTGCSNAPVLQ